MTYDEFSKEWADDAPCIHAKTSGSTGEPKDIALLKDDMLASARATNAFFGIDSNSVLAIPLTCDYIAGKMMAVRAYDANCRLLVIPPSNEFEIGDDHVDLLSIVPSQAECLISHPDWASRVRAVIVGGAALSLDRQDALAKAGYNIYMSYGMTETCSHVALAKIGEPFRAMPGISFEVDPRGCLIVDVPCMTIGRVVTNDIVELIDRYTFRWLGRYDNVINSGGIKIFPERLEAEISRYVDVDYYIVGIPDDKWGQAVQMVVAGDESMRADIENKLKMHLDHRFLPKNIHFVRMLPRTNTGKVKRMPYY